MKYQLPKDFAEKWILALRDKSNKDCTPKVVANKIDKKSSAEYLHNYNELYPTVLNKYLSHGNEGAANWIEQNIELV